MLEIISGDHGAVWYCPDWVLRHCNVLSAQCSQCLCHSTTLDSVGIHICVVQELTNNYVLCCVYSVV